MNFLPLGLFAAGLLFCLVFTAFGCTIVVSLASVAIACNQTLSSIMVQELCQSLYDDKEEMALALEDTTIDLAALVPWSVAAAVPLAALGASSWGIAAAVYLYLQPLWSWLRTSFRKREQGA